MNFIENIKVALSSIRSNFLRSFLTLLIIAVGITCLVGILTAIDTILLSMSSSFNRIGANSFTVYPDSENIRSNKRGRTVKRADPIIFEQAMKFKQLYKQGDALTSVNMWCGSRAEVSFGNRKTNPNVIIYGIDENYLKVSAFELAQGRNFTPPEILSGEHKAIIGNDIVKLLFNNQPAAALNKSINIGNAKYKIVGVLDSKGSSINNASDRRIFLPLYNAKQYYGYPNKNYNITTSVSQTSQIDNAVASAIGVMRNVRKLKVTESNDFGIRKSNGILEQLKDVTSKIRWATVAIALITLIGAAIGLMNIMLVSVTERTSEIGLRKAIGATSTNVLSQFLIEAVVICLIGGYVGIVFGILIGFLVAKFINGIFVVPIAWMTLGFVICIIVGIISGLYPAIKAARLDPIESLRYE